MPILSTAAEATEQTAQSTATAQSLQGRNRFENFRDQARIDMSRQLLQQGRRELRNHLRLQARLLQRRQHAGNSACPAAETGRQTDELTEQAADEIGRAHA